MKYSDKQIKKIINIQEFIAMPNTLSKVYLDFENKEYFINTFTDRDIIYRIYCASIYNLVKAIQDSKEFFVSARKYIEFEKLINQEYKANDNKYYKKENYKASLFKIIETIRHQVNHSLKDDEDNNILFDAYIDFEMLENLRIVINDIFYEIYNQIDKNRIKKIVLSKPKIKYSMDKLSNKVDELKIGVLQSNSKLNEEFKKDNERTAELCNELFNADNLYELFMKNPNAIKKIDDADEEIQQMLQKYEKIINQKGTEIEKNILEILKEFSYIVESKSIKDFNTKMVEIKDKLEKYRKNIE